MHSFSQFELRKLGVMIENFMKSFTKGAGKWQTNPAVYSGFMDLSRRAWVSAISRIFKSCRRSSN